MEVWNRKIIDYFVLKVVKYFPIDQYKLIQLNGHIMNCVFNEYKRGGKGYGLLEVEYRGSNFTILKYITFCESQTGRKSSGLKMKVSETMVDNTLFRVEFSSMDTCSNEGTITKTFDHHLNHYKVRRKILPSQEYNYVDIGSYV